MENANEVLPDRTPYIKALALEIELLVCGFDVNHTGRYTYEAKKKINGKGVRLVVDPMDVRFFLDQQIISQEKLKYFSLKRLLEMPNITGGTYES